MLRIRILKTVITILIALFIVNAASESAKAQVNIKINLFYDALKPHGAWFNYGNYGLCWKPYHISNDWRPYTNGHWMWTDYGWTWASDYSWGWAPFHYGRWIYDEWEGWVWIPDTEWGPAWVEWRYSDDYIGWAPLPPHVRMSHNIGYDYNDYGIHYKHWNFVHCKSFLNIHFDFISHRNINRFFHKTKNITHITYIDNRVYNHGPKRRDIERSTGRSISEYRIIEDRNLRGERSYNIDKNDMRVYRPEVNRSTGSTRTGNEIRNERTTTTPTENSGTNRNSERTQSISKEQTDRPNERVERKEDNTRRNERTVNTDRSNERNNQIQKKNSEREERIEKRSEKSDRSSEQRNRSNESSERSNSRSERGRESRERR